MGMSGLRLLESHHSGGMTRQDEGGEQRSRTATLELPNVPGIISTRPVHTGVTPRRNEGPVNRPGRYCINSGGLVRTI